jgi:hypothetical protein
MNTLVIKNSSVMGRTPLSADLVEAELAVNTADKKLFTKDALGNIIEINAAINSQTIESANQATAGSSTGSLAYDFSVKNLAVSGNILPAITGVSTIGSPTDKFAAVYTRELHIDANTLYVDGVPVIGSSANTIQITADLNQGLRLATTGTGQLILDSQTATTVQTNGLNADVLIH